ncbi:MAG: immune inhibitor A, partial [Chloroflexi bacterium]|nr:immune inhibitor A [Chloroflexota bacterium]
SSDSLPRWVNEFSAEREMIYMNTLGVRAGTDSFNSVLAHEFCHMIQFNRRARTAIWFNEGQAQLCERANGFSMTFETQFLRDPDTQLDTWTELDEGAAPHYGASYLFLEYLRARTGGGYGFINSLMSKGLDTVADLDKALRAAGHPPFEEILADWVAANAFIGVSGEAKLAYPSDVRIRESARPTTQDRVAVGSSLRATVHPQAARYVELPRTGQYRVRFEAPATARVVPTDAHSGGAFWWSDRADGMDSHVTREVDLTGARAPSVSFWTWFDIERDFDYGYVAVSTDGGKRWATLATSATTSADPNGNNLGHGFTGISGGGKDPVWIEQTADLVPYAGKRILLRFEHVTDGALNKGGFAVDDIEIAEIGYRDDAEADRGWDAKGFIRSTNLVRARYVVQVLHFGAAPKVERTIVQDGKLEIEVDASADRAAPLLAVTPLVPRSTEPIAFEVQVTPRR